ncbi:DNA repair protein RecO [Dehalococcoidia bacterium]|nr:DNA repair protein RecO [Dehalococcoidia bacterium]
MAKPRSYKTDGIILRQMPLGESDRLLTLYTPGYGKIRAVARRVRRTKSKLVGHTEPLTHSRLSISHGKSLDWISEAETIHSFRRIKEDLTLLTRSLYLSELVDGFSVELESNPPVYKLLLDTITIFNNTIESLSYSTLIRHFELRLLMLSGFGPDLHNCVECREELEPANHFYSCTRGGVLCKKCQGVSKDGLIPVSLNSMKVLRFLERQSSDAAAKLDVPEAIMREIEKLLVTNVTYVLEREIKSASFMKLVTSP